MFGIDGKPAGRGQWPFDTQYEGFNMQSDYSYYMTSFTVQFAWLAVAGMHSNPFWRDTIYPEWGQADRLWWTNQDNLKWSEFAASWGQDVRGRAFGCGAGDSPASQGSKSEIGIKSNFV